MRQNERFKNAVLGKPADRLPFFPIWGPWEQTLARWRDQGMARGEDWLTLPGFDNQWKAAPLNYWPVE